MTTRSPEEIRSEVSKAYGSRVRATLNSLDSIDSLPWVAPASAACCATESSSTDGSPCCESAPATDAACCGDTATEATITNVARLYAQTDVSDLPATVTDVAFGCGNPTAIAALQ